MKPLQKDLDVQAEVRAVVDFVQQKWTPIDSLGTLVSELQEKAFSDWRATFDALDGSFSATISGLVQKRDAALADQYDGTELSVAIDLDRPRRLLIHLLGSAMELQEPAMNIDGPWNFERSANAAYKGASLRHPGLSEAQPLGWRELRLGYARHDGMVEYDLKADADLFKGTDLDAPRTQPFHQMISLPQAMYNDVENRKRPASTLVSAIYSHFLGIRQYLNTAEMISSIEKLADWEVDGPVQGVQFTSQQPLVNVMLKLLPEQNVADFRAAVAAEVKSIAEYEALTDQEKASRRTELSNSLKAMLNSPSVEDIKQDQLHKTLVRKLLVDAYGTRERDPQNSSAPAL